MTKRSAEEMMGDVEELGGRMEGDPSSTEQCEIIDKKKHTLDSDEEDVVVKYDVLQDDDIDGQEDATVEFDGEIKITPFNLKEELAEGHFDKEGFYYFDKEDEIRDNWLSDIDWTKVKSDESKRSAKAELIDFSDEEPMNQGKQDMIYKQIIEYLQPGETVSKALRRLGGAKNMSSSQRWKQKRQAKANGQSSQDTEDSATKREDFLKLTGLADELTSNGHYDIYQESFEKINTKLKARSRPQAQDSLDMFGDDEGSEGESTRVGSTTKPDGGSSDAATTLADQIMWEYRTSADSTEVQGPYSSTQMEAWVDEGKFDSADTFLVRKIGQAADSDFYNGRRIDFSLYT